MGNMNPTSDEFSFNNITTAGLYVYIPMLIMSGLLLFSLFKKQGTGNVPVIPLLVLLGFLVGNLSYHNALSWINMNGKLIKMSGLMGYVGGAIGLIIGFMLKKKGMGVVTGNIAMGAKEM